MNKFIRRYRLTVEPTQGRDINGILVPGADQNIVIENPFTLDFVVQRHPFQQTNTSTFKIYNLNQTTRNALYKDYFSQYRLRIVTLAAGYEDPMPVIFKGNIISCNSYRAEGGVDYITEMKAWDFSFAKVNSFTSRTEKPGRTRDEVIAGLANDLTKYGVSTGVRSLFSGEYPRGRVICGPTWEHLQNETSGFAFIDNGRVYVLKPDDCFDGVLTEISSETGLLATPKRFEQGIIVETLFEPRIESGQRIILKSRENIYQGFEKQSEMKVMGISHQGTISDAVGGKCKTVASLILPFERLNVLTSVN